MLYLWYIDSSSNRNNLHTYATVKEYFQIMLCCITLLYSAIVNRDDDITLHVSLSEMYHYNF